MLTEKQLQQRQQFLGSSDAAAIVGHSPYGTTAWDVWAEKTGRTLSSRPAGDTKHPSNPALVVGSYFEDGLIRWLERERGELIDRSVRVVHTNGIMAANLDGVVHNSEPAILVEAKTAGLVGMPEYLEDFGDHGTDQIPAHYLIQIHHQFAVVNSNRLISGKAPAELCLVPTFIGGRGFVLFHVPRNQGLCDAIEAAELDFWRKYVQTDTPPPACLPSERTIRRLARTPNKIVKLSDEAVKEWRDASTTFTNAKNKKERAERKIQRALVDAEAGACSTGLVTFYQYQRAGHTVGPSTFRQLRFKKNKLIF